MAFRILAALVLILTVWSSPLANRRVVVVEDFTNVDCPGCNDIKDSMNVIFDEYEGRIAAFRTHLNWPNPLDPIYIFNPFDAQARRVLYGLTYMPTMRFDGMNLGDKFDFPTTAEFYSFVRNTLDSLLVVPAPLRIDVEHYRTLDSVFVNFDLVVTDVITGGQKVHLVVGETIADYGCFGEFKLPMRDYFPVAGGDTVYLRLGDSLHCEWNYAIPDSGVMAANLVNTIFVQKISNKQILQGFSAPVPTISTDIESGGAPVRIALGANTPNPFNPETTIPYFLSEPGRVELTVHDPTGRLIATLVDRQAVAGSHVVRWNGRDRTGSEVGSGIYFLRLRAPDGQGTRKITLVR